ncbi:hypothetical protein F5878DRAFT_719544 [Lentinula raphanica]|uniref:C2H2-type domain-containing protein n=1 Tax=Lentinula raphanica TaxID=153919 RepID=A0AA38NYT0_9AGAR|nr:hypothetical protein F5878DRAFT_719544 [Lentinula raphanica]
MLYPCSHPGCERSFPTNRGRSKHWNSAHRDVTQEPDDNDHEEFTYFRHPHLTAPPPPPPIPEAHSQESWLPFSNRIEFDFAHLHFVCLQSLAAEIKLALDMWAAQVLVSGGDPDDQPWVNADQLYETIDAIDDINYQGHRPPVPPTWMTQKYTLLIRDIRALFHYQMRMKDFDDSQFNKVPYRQFNKQGKRVRSNIMSADWAWKQCDIIAEDPANHGAMFVPFVSGSDKTTVSVATGHQEYYPVYASPCNLTNVTRRSHPFALCPVAFLLIPKTTKSQRKKPVYQQFVQQMYHASLAAVFEPLRAAMTTPEVVMCMNRPEDLDAMNARPRTRTKTEFLITSFDPGIVWDEYRARSDVVSFTSYFPRADIHELLTPDLLHQMIKGTFKDHLVEWVTDYINETHPATQALEILKDIDRRYVVNAVPPFPGLRRFPDGRDFTQWTGDDSKALMKVYLAAIVGYVPPDMIKAMSSFLDFYYIARRNSLSTSDLSEMEDLLARFHHFRTSFIDAGVRDTISLPRQHGLTHYVPGIQLFGSPNGLCSSITESKHIKSVKEPCQMVTSITRSDKLIAMRRRLEKQGMMVGMTFSYVEMIHSDSEADRDIELHEIADLGPATKSSVHLAVTPDAEQPHDLELCPTFSGRITVYHSAVTWFYAPSDLCGVGGMHSERIQSHPRWRNSYSLTNQSPFMCGLTVAQRHECALVNWFERVADVVDEETGMWVIRPEYDAQNRHTLEVIHVDSIARGLPEDFSFHHALLSFRAFYVNKYASNHVHEFLNEKHE